MRRSKESKKKTRPSSPLRDRTGASTRLESRRYGSSPSSLSPSASLLDRDLVTGESNLLGDLKLSPDDRVSDYNPRSFPHSVKQQCWDKAEKIKGRDPDRWRRDALGNVVFRKLVGCPGCLCHDYDHILPYSKVVALCRFFYFTPFVSLLFLFFSMGLDFCLVLVIQAVGWKWTITLYSILRILLLCVRSWFCLFEFNNLGRSWLGGFFFFVHYGFACNF